MERPTPRLWREKIRFRVRNKMRDAKISYSDLSARLSERGLETAKSTVGAWMDGRNEPPMAIIKEIGEILGMSVSEIFGEDLYIIQDPLTRQIVERLDRMDEDEKRALLKLLGFDNKNPPPNGG